MLAFSNTEGDVGAARGDEIVETRRRDDTGAFAGSNVWRNDKIVTVKELFSTLVQELNEYRNRIKISIT